MATLSLFVQNFSPAPSASPSMVCFFVVWPFFFRKLDFSVYLDHRIEGSNYLHEWS